MTAIWMASNRFPRRRWVSVAGLCALCALNLACSPSEARLDSDALSRLADGAATGSPVRTGIAALGRIDARSHTRRLSPQRAGVLEAVAVAVGDRVERGQLLAQLECAEERAALLVADAAVERASADLRALVAGARSGAVARAAAQAEAAARLADRAEDSYRRQQAVREANYASAGTVERLRQELEAARAERRAAEAHLADLAAGPRPVDRAVAEARVREAQANANQAAAVQENCELRSPVDGDVLRVVKHAGEFVSGNAADYVLAVADTTELIVRAEIDERDLNEVRVGARAHVPLRW